MPDAPPHIPVEEPSGADLAFEREKWLSDVEFRRQELKLKRRQEDRLREEARRNRWANPLVVGIFAAAVAGLINAGITWYNDKQQSDIQQGNNSQQIKIENFKAEASRLLEAIRTGNPTQSAVNLQFLLDTGLIKDDTTRSNLQQYFATHKPDQFPATANPSQQSPFSSALIGDITSDQLKTFLQGGFILGVDISSHQGIIDLKAMAAKNVKFVYIKSSQGDHAPNPILASQAKAADDANIKVGLYHLLEANIDVTQQFNAFADSLSSVSWQLPPAVDVERAGSAPAPVDADSVIKFCSLIENKFHVRPIIYTGIPGTGMARPDGYSFWVPRYSRLRNPPGGNDYLIWQISVQGISDDPVLSGIDLNVFKGELDQLLAIGAPTQR